MKIKTFEVSGLSKRTDFSFNFHDDINILTGINGSGKTTALKLAWYIVSGNFARLRNEIKFKKCSLTTDTFSLSLENIADNDIGFELRSNDKDEMESGTFNENHYDSDGDPFSDGEDFLRDLIRELSPSSIYFPTFRRVEGGYSIVGNRRNRLSHASHQGPIPESNLALQMEQLSSKLSYGPHKFVCSISTDDIAALLTERYAKTSEGVNNSYTEFSRSILDKIRNWRQETSSHDDQSEKLLLEIQASATQIEEFRGEAFKPFTVLSALVAKMFSFQGIKVRNLSLGDAAKAIDSDILSAGEKQMLSFLVYNAFSAETPIFIDEPELSLHPDWQRKLFPTLLDQQATNQFIISTHSPFIYSKYSDKELPLNSSRGD